MAQDYGLWSLEVLNSAFMIFQVELLPALDRAGLAGENGCSTFIVALRTGVSGAP